MAPQLQYLHTAQLLRAAEDCQLWRTSAAVHHGEFRPGDQACERDEFAPTYRPRLAVAYSVCLEIEWPYASDATTSLSLLMALLQHTFHTEHPVTRAAFATHMTHATKWSPKRRTLRVRGDRHYVLVRYLMSLAFEHAASSIRCSNTVKGSHRGLQRQSLCSVPK